MPGFEPERTPVSPDTVTCSRPGCTELGAWYVSSSAYRACNQHLVEVVTGEGPGAVLVWPVALGPAMPRSVR